MRPRNALPDRLNADRDRHRGARRPDLVAPDLAPPDLAPRDLAPPADLDRFGAPRCPTVGTGAVLFCEDFESGVIDPARWQSNGQTNGTVSIDSVRSGARGSRALHS